MKVERTGLFRPHHDDNDDDVDEDEDADDDEKCQGSGIAGKVRRTSSLAVVNFPVLPLHRLSSHFQPVLLSLGCFPLLAPQSVALRISAYRDFHSIHPTQSTYSFLSI